MPYIAPLTLRPAWPEDAPDDPHTRKQHDVRVLFTSAAGTELAQRETFVLKKNFVVALGLGMGTLIIAASAACGGSARRADVTGGQPDVVVDVSLKDLRYTPNTVEVAAGKTVQVNVTNMDGMDHDMVVDGLRIEKVGEGEATGGHHAGVTPSTFIVHTMANENGSITFRTEQKGTYQFYCSLPGHKDAGMVGEMTVS